MGIWDLLYSTNVKVKQNVPDLTRVTNAFYASGEVVNKIYKAVKVNGTQKLTEYMPDSQGREKIKRIATEVAVPEVLRFTGIPGLVQAYRIYREGRPTSSVHDNEKFEQQSKELKEIKEKYEELVDEVKNTNPHIHDNEKFEQQSKELKEIKEKYEELVDEVKNTNPHNEILTELIEKFESQE